MNGQIQGTLIKIFDEKRINDKMTVRDIVVKTGGQYPQEVLLQLINQKCDLIIGHHTGEEVTAHYNIRGRKGKDGDKWFNTIEAWKLEF